MILAGSTTGAIFKPIEIGRTRYNRRARQDACPVRIPAIRQPHPLIGHLVSSAGIITRAHQSLNYIASCNNNALLQ